MDYINEFLLDANIEQHLAPATIKTYRKELMAFKAWFEDSNNEAFGINNITPLDIKEYKGFLVRQQKKPNTINKAIATIKSFMKWAIRKGYINYNPALGIVGVHQSQVAPKWLERKEQLALIREIFKEDNPRNKAIVFLMLHAGLRVSEVVNVKITDVSVSERKGIVIIRSGKGDKYREVPLNKDVRQAITSYLQVHKPKGEYLFDSQRGEKLTTRGVQKMLKKYADRIGLDIITPHSLRHTFCKELVKKGVPLDVVAILAGHITKDGQPNIKTTMIYTTPSAKELAKAVEELEWS